MSAPRMKRRSLLIRGVLAAILGVGAAALVSCGGSSAKLIPVGDATPLQNDFEAVARAAESGDGECSATESALSHTEQDFQALPASVDSGLRNRLREGVVKLHQEALAQCARTTSQTTSSQSKSTTKTTTTKPTTTQTSTSETQSTTTTSSSTPAPTPPENESGGGTPAPPEPAPGAPGAGGGTGAGEAGAGPGQGAGAQDNEGPGLTHGRFHGRHRGRVLR